MRWIQDYLIVSMVLDLQRGEEPNATYVRDTNTLIVLSKGGYPAIILRDRKYVVIPVGENRGWAFPTDPPPHGSYPPRSAAQPVFLKW